MKYRIDIYDEETNELKGYLVESTNQQKVVFQSYSRAKRMAKKLAGSFKARFEVEADKHGISDQLILQMAKKEGIL